MNLVLIPMMTHSVDHLSYISDDCHSQLSESNSEQWESSETLERNNHGLYDGLCGISSEELISTSPELGGISHNATYDDGGSKSVHTENGLEHSLSDPVLDLPSFDALGPVLQQETKDDSDPKDLPGLRCSVDYTPGPPPLPPVEWRASKPPSNVTEEKQDAFEGFRHALNAELLGSITLQQPKPPVQQQQMNEDFIKPKRKDQHLNGQKEADQALNGKGMDEKEDFLQQIRTKVSHLFFLSFGCFPSISHFVFVLERFILVCETCQIEVFLISSTAADPYKLYYLEQAWLY
nr:SCAR-like protein 2 isoform X2 [Malus domestica]